MDSFTHTLLTAYNVTTYRRKTRAAKCQAVLDPESGQAGSEEEREVDVIGGEESDEDFEGRWGQPVKTVREESGLQCNNNVHITHSYIEKEEIVKMVRSNLSDLLHGDFHLLIVAQKSSCQGRLAVASKTTVHKSCESNPSGDSQPWMSAGEKEDRMYSQDVYLRAP